jgi:hypothetical protein
MSTSANDRAIVLLARRCHTMTGNTSRTQAIAIKRGHIVDLGTHRRIMAHAGPRTRIIDLGDATLTPGLIDAHTHFVWWALQRILAIDVTGLPTLPATLDRLRRQAPRIQGDWIIAASFDHNLWGSGFPTAQDLDQAVRDRPVLVRSRDAHSVWLNSAGLRRAGIGPRTADPTGGRYLRDQHGRPTGIVQEAAIETLPDPVHEFAARQDRAALRVIDRALEQAYAAAWALGLVGVHTMDGAASLFHLQRHHRAGRLGMRIVHAVPRANLVHAAALGLRSGLGDEWLRLGAVKLFCDGALGSQTAYMFTDYPGRPKYRGVPVLAGAALEDTVVAAARAGWPVWIHAIGDRAVHEALRAIAAARRVEDTPLPHRIEHAQCVRPADVRRMARLGVAASVQPCHLPGDIATADRHWPRARRNAYPLRSLLAAGVTLAAGSDVPIESLDPRRGLFGATCRTDEADRPFGGWFPQQALTTVAALRAYTVGPRRSVGEAAPAGTLAIGAPADVTIWAADPLSTPPERLRDVPILGCVVGGHVHLTES